MYKKNLVIFALLTQLNIKALPQLLLKSQRNEVCIKVENASRKSYKYFDNDTSTYTAKELEFAKYSKNRFPAINISYKHYIPKKIIIFSEFRYKLWGFEEYFPVPYRGITQEYSHSFAITFFNLDVSIGIYKRINLHKRFEFRPRASLTCFVPFSKGLNDSIVHQSFGGKSEDNEHYKGKKIKIGGSVGSDLVYKFSRRFHLNLSCNYYSPFNNTYNWQLSYRVKGLENPWRKYKKKNDGLYFGLGIDLTLGKPKENKNFIRILK